MKTFLDKLNQNQRDFYGKIMLISGITERTLGEKERRALESKLTNEETYDFCRFNVKNQLSSNMINKIRGYRETATGNTCLHIASQYGNLTMMKLLVENHINNPDQKNKEEDTSLSHSLKTSNSINFQKSILFLSRYSDLSVKDRDNKLPHEVTLATYSKSRARIMEILKEKYLERLSKK